MGEILKEGYNGVNFWWTHFVFQVLSGGRGLRDCAWSSFANYGKPRDSYPQDSYQGIAL